MFVCVCDTRSPFHSRLDTVDVFEFALESMMVWGSSHVGWSTVTPKHEIDIRISEFEERHKTGRVAQQFGSADLRVRT